MPKTRPVVRRRILKGRRDDVSNIVDFSKLSVVSLKSIFHELIRDRRYNLATERQLPADHVILQSLPVELLMQLEIPVVVFPETDVDDIHWPRGTGALHFRNQGRRNGWVMVKAGSEEMYGTRRGRVSAKPVALFKFTDYTCENAVRWVAAVCILSPVS